MQAGRLIECPTAQGDTFRRQSGAVAMGGRIGAGGRGGLGRGSAAPYTIAPRSLRWRGRERQGVRALDLAVRLRGPVYDKRHDRRRCALLATLGMDAQQLRLLPDAAQELRRQPGVAGAERAVLALA